MVKKTWWWHYGQGLGILSTTSDVLLLSCSWLLFPTIKSQVLTVLFAKFMEFPWQPLLFSYLHLSISHFICGLRLAVPDLKNYCHLLQKQSLVPDPSIIITRFEKDFDSCHLSLLDHLDQKIRPNFFFHIYFNIAQ